MKKYIGSKIIKAEPMTEYEFKNEVKGENMKPAEGQDREGYLVIYADGYKSWSPKDVFEIAYREVTKGEEDIICEVE